MLVDKQICSRYDTISHFIFLVISAIPNLVDFCPYKKHRILYEQSSMTKPTRSHERQPNKIAEQVGTQCWVKARHTKNKHNSKPIRWRRNRTAELLRDRVEKMRAKYAQVKYESNSHDSKNKLALNLRQCESDVLREISASTFFLYENLP